MLFLRCALDHAVHTLKDPFTEAHGLLQVSARLGHSADTAHPIINSNNLTLKFMVDGRAFSHHETSHSNRPLLQPHCAKQARAALQAKGRDNQ